MKNTRDWKMPSKKLSNECQVVVDFVEAAILFALALGALMYFTACTVQVDNPFYSPRSLDVNKIESKAVNNYLTQGKQDNK